MATRFDTDKTTRGSQFASQAARRRGGPLRECWEFLRYNKRWWLTPIILIFLVAGLITVLGGTAAAPFIYTLF